MRQRYIFTILVLHLFFGAASAQFVREVDSLMETRKAWRYEPENNLIIHQFSINLYNRYGAEKVREQIALVLESQQVSTDIQIVFANMIQPLILEAEGSADSVLDRYIYLLRRAYQRAERPCDAFPLLESVAGIYNMEKQHALAKEVYDFMLEELKRNSCGSALVPFHIGLSRNIYMPLGNNAQAAEHYLKALHILDSLKAAHAEVSPYYEYNVYNEIASLNYFTGNYADAITYWQKALVLIELENRWTNSITGIYNNIGLAYRKLKQYDKAKEFLRECIKQAIQTNDQAWIGIATGNIGAVLADEDRYDEAIPLLLKDIRISARTFQYGSLTNAYGKVGYCYAKLNNYAKAKAYYDSALYSIDRWPKPVMMGTYTYNALLELYSNFAELEFLRGNFKDAYLYQQRSSVFHDSLKTMQKRQELTLVKSYHTFERQDAENKLLKAKVKAQELREITVLIMAILGASILIFAVAIYRLRLHKVRAEAKALDAAKQAEYERSLRLEEELRSAEAVSALRQQQVEEELGLRGRELSSITVQIQQKNEVMVGLKSQLEKIVQKESGLQDDLKLLYKSVRKDLNLSADWEKFKVHFEQVHPDFFTRLNESYPDISLSDLRICAYLRMNMDNASIAHVLNVSTDSLRVRRHRLRKRMGFQTDKEIYNYLASM